VLTYALAPPKISAAVGILVGIFTMKPPIIFNLSETVGHRTLTRVLGILVGISAVNDFMQQACFRSSETHGRLDKPKFVGQSGQDVRAPGSKACLVGPAACPDGAQQFLQRDNCFSFYSHDNSE